MVSTASLIRVRTYSKLAGRSGIETLSLTYPPHTEQFRSVKAGDRGGQAIGQPRLIHDDLQDF